MLLRRLIESLIGRRGKFAALALWVVIAAVAGPLALKLSEVQDNEQLMALPAGVEAQLAADRAKAAFPEPETSVAVAVYARDSALRAADEAKVESDRQAFARFAEGGQIGPPTSSDDGQALLLTFPLGGDEEAQGLAVDEIRERLAADVPAGLRTALTGSAGAMSDLFDAFEGMDIALLLATGAAVALLLIITYRSPVLWLVPLLVVGIASQVASAVVYLLARYADLNVDLQSQSVQTILVFGVGVDYALLLIARYREELRRHSDRHAAMRKAVRRSLPAIAASAATVGLALLCLLLADIPATRGLGPVGAAGILVAFLTMTMLLPPLLLLFGRWIFWPFIPRVGDTTPQHRGWHRVAAAVGRRPHATWIVALVVIGGLTLGIGNLSIGLPGNESFTKEVGSITGQHLIEDHFAAGILSPADIVATAGSADAIATAAKGVDGVAEVLPAEVSADGQWARVRVVLADEAETHAATDTVRRLRDAVDDVPGADALIGGVTAATLDVETAANRDNWMIAPLVLVVVLLVLILVLRSLVAPLILLASVILSYLAALGVSGLILSAWGHPRLWVAIPLQSFLFLVALGVDYSIFLMTRAREETVVRGHDEGVRHALAVTGGVITSAGVVLAATFAALSVLPLVPSVQNAVIVSVGVLLDTFLIRTLLIPSVSLGIGRRTWWPSRLSRPAQPVVESRPAEPSGAPTVVSVS